MCGSLTLNYSFSNVPIVFITPFIRSVEFDFLFAFSMVSVLLVKRALSSSNSFCVFDWPSAFVLLICCLDLGH